MIPNSLPYRRVSVLLVIMGLSALAMFIQLIRVQFGPYAPVFSTWIEAAEDTETEIEPVRGLIYDRDGDLLATNVPMYYLEIEVFQLTPASRKQIAAVLARTLVLPYEDLVRVGGMVAAKKQGLVRLEGKGYVLQDGEIGHFLFNV